MQNFSEERFPTDISYGMSGGPKFNTDIITTNTGSEYRNLNSLYARNKYNVATGIKTKEQLVHLLTFFRAMRGRAVAFRFKDWLDFRAINQTIAVADGKTQEFQLIKIYQIGEFSEKRRITKPVANLSTIYLENKITTNGHINPLNGILSFRYPPQKGTIISADFEFDVPVRFDTDYISAAIENYGVHSILDIPLIEVFI
jgi:uncharacterized protein (TIGR02217 family)